MQSMSEKMFDRRRTSRKTADLPSRLKVSTYGEKGAPRTFAAKLIDTTDTGIGVEMYVPLVEGSIVALDGELTSSDLSLNLRGRARVVYCRCDDGGTFRVGLAYEEIAYRKTA